MSDKINWNWVWNKCLLVLKFGFYSCPIFLGLNKICWGPSDLYRTFLSQLKFVCVACPVNQIFFFISLSLELQVLAEIPSPFPFHSHHFSQPPQPPRDQRPLSSFRNFQLPLALFKRMQKRLWEMGNKPGSAHQAGEAAGTALRHCLTHSSAVLGDILVRPGGCCVRNVITLLFRVPEGSFWHLCFP